MANRNVDCDKAQRGEGVKLALRLQGFDLCNKSYPAAFNCLENGQVTVDTIQVPQVKPIRIGFFIKKILRTLPEDFTGSGCYTISFLLWEQNSINHMHNTI